jgi:hypothetical protein
MEARIEYAKGIYKRTLRRFENEPGKEHTVTLMIVLNLAITYELQGKFQEAELFKRARE